MNSFPSSLAPRLSASSEFFWHIIPKTPRTRHTSLVLRRFVTSRSSLFWDVTRRTLVFTDVSGQLNGSIFKGQHVECNVAQPAQPDAVSDAKSWYCTAIWSQSWTERGTTVLRLYRNYRRSQTGQLTSAWHSIQGYLHFLHHFHYKQGLQNLNTQSLA
jgi:hypothetical protein